MASYLDYNGLQTFWTRLKEIISGVQSDVSNLSNNKQDKTDNSLTTGDKSVVGAINELNKGLGSVKGSIPKLRSINVIVDGSLGVNTLKFATVTGTGGGGGGSYEIVGNTLVCSSDVIDGNVFTFSGGEIINGVLNLQ